MAKIIVSSIPNYHLLDALGTLSNSSIYITIIGYHRIIEYAELEGTHQDYQVQLCGAPLESHVPESVMQTLLELREAWCCDHCLPWTG